MFIITKAISESYLDFTGNHSEYFVFCVLSINNRHFLPFGRADLAASASLWLGVRLYYDVRPIAITLLLAFYDDKV